MRIIRNIICFIVLCLILLFPVQASATNEKELFVVAQRAFEDGFYDVSLRYIDQLLKEFPQTSKMIEAKLLLGQCYFFKQHYLKAFNVFQDLSKRSEYKDVVLFWLGETYLKVGDISKAQVQYSQIIDAYPNSLYAPQAYYSLGWSYFEKANYPEAKKVFLKQIELFPSNSLSEDATFKIAECDYNVANYEGAIFQFNKYIAAYSNSSRSSEAVFNIAESYYYLEQFDKAALNYEKAKGMATDPKIALNALVGKGWSLFKKGSFEDSLKVFESALVHAQANQLPEDDILFGKASLFASQDRYSDAAGFYGQVIEKYPSSIRVMESYLGRANAFYLANIYQKAIDDYMSLIQLALANKNSTILEKARFGLAWTYLKNGNLDKAIESFQVVFDTTENKTVKVSALTQIGDAFHDMGQLDKAVEVYDKILRNMPDSPYSDYVQYRLGVVLLKQGQVDASILALQALNSNYPQSKYNQESQYYLGAAYFRNNDWNAALDILRPFIRSAHPTSEFAPEARYLEALALFNLKKYDAALQSFLELQKLYPKNASMQQNASLGMAKVKYMSGNTKESIAQFEQLVVEYPNTETALEALFWLGDYYVSTGLYEKAEAVYRQLINSFPSHERILLANYELGRVYFSQGVLDKALEQFRKLENSSNNELAAKAKLAIADVFTKEMNPDRAVDSYQNIIKTSPEYKRDALLKIANIERKSGNFDKEIAAYQDALSSEKGVSQIKDVQIHFMMGDTFELMNKSDKAIEEYFKIPYLFPKEVAWLVKAYLRIAKIYENQEDWDKAITAYSKISVMDVDEAKFSKERISWINANREKK